MFRSTVMNFKHAALNSTASTVVPPHQMEAATFQFRFRLISTLQAPQTFKDGSKPYCPLLSPIVPFDTSWWFLHCEQLRSQLFLKELCSQTTGNGEALSTRGASHTDHQVDACLKNRSLVSHFDVGCLLARTPTQTPKPAFSGPGHMLANSHGLWI